MATHDHRYAPGWEPNETLTRWTDSVDMDAWRFCPPCGLPLKASDFENDGPVCTGCQHPWEACPCACLDDSPTHPALTEHC